LLGGQETASPVMKVPRLCPLRPFGRRNTYDWN
jgi:hypothetical protein